MCACHSVQSLRIVLTIARVPPGAFRAWAMLSWVLAVCVDTRFDVFHIGGQHALCTGCAGVWRVDTNSTKLIRRCYDGRKCFDSLLFVGTRQSDALCLVLPARSPRRCSCTCMAHNFVLSGLRILRIMRLNRFDTSVFLLHCVDHSC